MTRLVFWLLDTERTRLVYALVAWPIATVPALALIVGMILGLSALGLDLSIGSTLMLSTTPSPPCSSSLARSRPNLRAEPSVAGPSPEAAQLEERWPRPG
jgi:hypothetical protein